MAANFTLDTSTLSGTDVLGATTLNMSNAFPTLIVEVGFANNALDDPVTWTDITLYVRNVQVNRGRQHELNRFEAGTATVVVSNRDGRFSPFNTSSPYNPNVLPFKPIRIRAKWNGQVYPVFRGFIESWPVKWPTAADSDVTINAVDATKAANLKKATRLGSYSTTITADSPYVYYRMGDAPGSTLIIDSSGNSRHGSLVDFGAGGGISAPTPNSYNSTAFGAASGLAADSDTSWDAGGYAGLISVSNFSLSGTGPLSIEAWIKVRSVKSAANPIIFQAGSGSFGTGVPNVFFGINYGSGSGGTGVPQGSLSLSTFDGGGTRLQVNGNRVISDNAWHHVVGTIAADGKSGVVYVDGAQDGTGTTVTAATLTGITWADWAHAAFDGLIDEAAFYTTQLSTTQVTNHYNAGAKPRNAETTGARIGAYLDAIGWPASLRQLDAGVSSVQAATNDAVTNSALANAQVAADTEGGPLFIAADGSIVFYNRTRTSYPPFNTPQVVLGDSGVLATEEPYEVESVDIQFDDLDLYNDVTVTPSGLGTMSASDSTSQTTYGKRTLALSGIHYASTDALGQAQYNVGLYKNPLQRVRSVGFTPYSDPDILFKAALGFELLTRVKLIRRPIDGSSSSFSQESLIEGVTHDIAPGYWHTSWRLSPTAANRMFVLDQSLLDGTDLLGW